MRPAGRDPSPLWLALAAGLLLLGAACAREVPPPPRPAPASAGAQAPASALATLDGSAGASPAAPPGAGSDGGPEGSRPAKPPCRCLYDLDPSTRSMRICEIDEPDHRGSTECIGPNK